MLRISILIVITLFSVPSTHASSPPEWVRADRGVVTLEGSRWIFAVGQAEEANPALARNAAGLRARQRLSRILLEAAAPAPEPAARGRDSLFGDMMRHQVSRSLDEATLDGVEVRATWTSPDGETFAIAIVPESAMKSALKRVPMAESERSAVFSELGRSLGSLEDETALPPEAIPLVVPESFEEKSDSGAPSWIDFSCGRYRDKGEEVLFAVGVAKLSNPALAVMTADNRARSEISRCVSFHIEQRDGSLKLFSANTLWGVRIVDHHYGPDGSVYALARVPTASLPAPEQDAVARERLRREEEASPDDKPRLSESADASESGCENPRRGPGFKIALGVIGPEAEYLRQRVKEELSSRRFRILDPQQRRPRAEGQLVLAVKATPKGDLLEECIMEVEYLKGTKTMNRGTYGCRLGTDPEAAGTVRVADLRRYAEIAKCSIADNLWLAARAARKARKDQGRRR